MNPCSFHAATMVAVTGASGFVGSAVVRELAESGQSVVGLVRWPQTSTSYRKYDLSASLDEALLTGVDSIVHCAFVRADRGNRNAFEINVKGTLKLFERAVLQGIRFIFVSSLSAVPGARSRYGQHKLLLERLLLERGACIVRPGLVVGDGGLVRSLYDAMRRLRLIPLIDGGRQPVQCVGQRDLAAVIRLLVERRSPPASVTVAAEVPVTARRMALDLRDRFALKALPLSLPYPVMFPLVSGAEAIGLRPPISRENLLGLRSAVLQPVTDVPTTFGFTLKSWGELLSHLNFSTQ